MRSGLAETQERTVTSRIQEGTAPPTAVPNAKELPYDYVAKFELTGSRGHRVPAVINISVEGAFIATSIGYGFLPRPAAQQKGQISGPANAKALALTFPATLAQVVAEAFALSKIIKPAKADSNDVRNEIASGLVCLFKRFCGIDFKYSIVDSATGRELQNQPIHNIAGLGSADGDRPFRPFPKPMTFLPRSTIRIEVEEISEGPLYAGAELQIVLHGYKVLGYGTALP
jgi:hypothetical protein